MKRLPVVATALLVMVAVPLALAARSPGGPVHSFDVRVSEAARVYGAHHPGFLTAMRWVTELGTEGAGAALLVPVLVWLGRAGRWRLATYAVVVVAATPVFIEPAKLLVHRARPTFGGHFVGFSFPSGHSVHIATYVLLLWGLALPPLGRRWRAHRYGGAAVAMGATVAVGVLAVVGVGGSRVALGAHYPTDVFAGWALGAAWVGGMAALFAPWACEAGSDTPRPPASGVRGAGGER